MTFQMQQGDGKLRANPQIVQTATNVYSMTLGAQTQLDKVQNTKFGVPDPSTFSETVTVGNATGSFTPCLNLPRASWVSSPCNIKIQLVGPNALFSTSQIVTANAITGLQSVRAINSSLQVDHSPVGLTPGFNEWGGLDHTTKLLKASAAPGGKLTYSMTLTNCQAFLQPSLTKEWTVGQDLGNGVTVASVTDTDVTGTDGLVHAHRPPYVVNALVFMHSSKGGMVQDTDANVGLTTGEIGVLYARIATDSSPTPQTGYTSWSFNGSTLTETLPTFTNPVYPIVLSPAGDTFGYTTVGSTSWTGAFPINHSNQGTAGFFPSPGAETISNLNIYANFTVAGNYVELGVYTDSSAPVIFKTNSNTAAISVGTSAAWVSGNPIGSASVAASTNYDIAVQISSSISITAYYNSGTYNQSLGGAYTYGTWGNLANWAFHPNFTNRNISIYCTCTAGGGVTISNSPSSVSFGTVMPGTTYYSYNQSTGSYPNPVTSSQCHFTITNGGSGSVNLAMSCSNATTGNTWTLVSSAPSGDQFEVIAVYNGENPASGLVLTNSNQSFYSGLTASGTLLWDFEEILGGTGTGKSGTFSDSATKTYTITITGS